MKFQSIYNLRNNIPLPMIDDDTPTFMGMPLARNVSELKGADFAIIGVPYASTRPTPGRDPNEFDGYAQAPRRTRINSLRYAGYLPEFDLDVFDHVKMVDYGDVEIVDDVAQSSENCIKKIEEVVAAGVRPITIGGGSPPASYAVAGGIARRTAGKVGTLCLDAHGDCTETSYPGNPTGVNGQNWELRMWQDFPNIDPHHHCEIGMRGPRNAKEMIATLRDVGARAIVAAEVFERGIGPVTAEAIERTFTGVEKTWMQIDLDVLDIGAVPDWGDEPMGLSVRDCIHVVHEAARNGLNGLSFVFVAPVPGISKVISYAAIYYIAGLLRGGHVISRATGRPIGQ